MEKERLEYYSNKVTYHSYKIILYNGLIIYGFFDFFLDTLELKKNNKWRIIENKNVSKYKSLTKLTGRSSVKCSTIIDGNKIWKIFNTITLC